MRGTAPRAARRVGSVNLVTGCRSSHARCGAAADEIVVGEYKGRRRRERMKEAKRRGRVSFFHSFSRWLLGGVPVILAVFNPIIHVAAAEGAQLNSTWSRNAD